MQEQGLNCFQIEGVLSELGALRYSPGGVPVQVGRIEHGSKQFEAGVLRDVGLEMPVVAVGDKARMLGAARLGSPVRISGFVAARSLRSRTPVLHIDTIEFLEGIHHGIQAGNEA